MPDDPFQSLNNGRATRKRALMDQSFIVLSSQLLPLQRLFHGFWARGAQAWHDKQCLTYPDTRTLPSLTFLHFIALPWPLVRATRSFDTLHPAVIFGFGHLSKFHPYTVYILYISVIYNAARFRPFPSPALPELKDMSASVLDGFFLLLVHSL